jgi:alpha-mannosidase
LRAAGIAVRGNTARGAPRTGFPVSAARVSDLRENPLTPVATGPDGELPLALRPFQVLTVRLRRA